MIYHQYRPGTAGLFYMQERKLIATFPAQGVFDSQIEVYELARSRHIEIEELTWNVGREGPVRMRREAALKLAEFLLSYCAEESALVEKNQTLSLTGAIDESVG